MRTVSRHAANEKRRAGAPWGLGLLLVSLVGTFALGGEPPRGKGAAGPLAMVPRDGTAFVTVRVAAAWESKGLEKFRLTFGAQVDEMLKKGTGLSIGDIERVTVALAEKDWKDPGMKGPPEMWAIIQTKKPLERDKVLDLLGRERREFINNGKTFYSSAKEETSLFFAGEKEFWISPVKVMPSLLDGSRKIAKEGPLAAALDMAALGKHHLVAGFHLPQVVKDLMREKGAPPEAAALLEVVSGTIAVSFDEGGLLEARAKFTGAAVAAKAAEQAQGFLNQTKAMLAKVKDDPKAKKAFGPLDPALIDQALAAIKIEAKGLEVSLTAPGGEGALVVVAGLMIPAGKKVGEAAERTITTNNLRQILIAMHAYHDVNRKLPPAQINKGLSWRVATLPYIEGADLYKRFHLDEPWDSPHNIKLLEEMPVIYKPVGGAPAKPGHTCFQVFTGDNLLFHATMDLKSNLARIKDGASNTLLVVESSKLVPWTKPDDIAYQPFKGQPRPPLGHLVPGQFLIGFADGTVRWLASATAQDILDRLIDPGDGKEIPVLP